MGNLGTLTVKALGRRLYRIAVTLGWLLVLCIALETCETGRAVIAEHLYKDYFEAQYAKVYRMVPAEKLAEQKNQFVLPESGKRAQRPLAKGPAIPGDARGARAAFAAQSEANRNAIATLQGECTVSIDRDGRYISSYGDPFLEQSLLPGLLGPSIMPPDLAHIVEAARSATATKEFRFSRGEGDLLFDYDVFVSPKENANGAVAEILFRESPGCPHQAGSPPTDDTAWDVTCYRYKPNWGDPGDMLRTNTYGFRDDDVSVPKPEGLLRIVCVGGSTTEEGNSNDATYPNIMERKLQAHFGPGAVDVVNCGICGLDSYREQMRMRDYLELEPDLLLYYNAINDIAHRHFAVWMERAKPWQKLLRRSRFLNRYFNRMFLPSDEELAAFMEATTFRNLGAMHYAAKERGVDMAICSFACPEVPRRNIKARLFLDVNMATVWHGGYINFSTCRKIVDLHNRLLKDMCERDGILYVPVAENLQRGMDHFFDICHMTPLGLELKTNIIGAYIREYIEDKRAASGSTDGAAQ